LLLACGARTTDEDLGATQRLLTLQGFFRYVGSGLGYATGRVTDVASEMPHSGGCGRYEQGASLEQMSVL
jgi:hypothetical protein